VRVAALPSGERPRAGEPTESNSCGVIRHVPEALRLRHVMRPFGIAEEFYDKFTEAYGIPVVGECKTYGGTTNLGPRGTDVCLESRGELSCSALPAAKKRFFT